MLEALTRFVEPIVQYPFSTGVHWILMFIMGALTVRSHYRGGPMLRVIPTVIVAMWTAYECMEYAQLRDNVSGDIANGLMAYIIGAASQHGINQLFLWLHKKFVVEKRRHR